MTGIGNRIAPWRFLLFAGAMLAATPPAIATLGWRHGLMAGFDIAAVIFIAACVPLFGEGDAESMRRRSAANDANRVGLLALTVIVTLALLTTVITELGEHGRDPATIVLVVATLILAWGFANLVYALHYAHLYYLRAADGGDRGGIEIPGTPEPDYGDFLYFAATLGMTFQTADVNITGRTMRRTVTAHTLAAFIFNIGVLAFSVNILGG